MTSELDEKEITSELNEEEIAPEPKTVELEVSQLDDGLADSMSIEDDPTSLVADALDSEMIEDIVATVLDDELADSNTTEDDTILLAADTTGSGVTEEIAGMELDNSTTVELLEEALSESGVVLTISLTNVIVDSEIDNDGAASLGPAEDD